jgi:aldehyde dehydrogenase (NAD+)
MRYIDSVYVNGGFVKPHGMDTHDLVNPATAEIIGQCVLGDDKDVQDAVCAAKNAQVSFSRSHRKERGQILQRLHDSVLKRENELNQTAILEYGSPMAATVGRTRHAANLFLLAKEVMESYPFEQRLGDATTVMTPLGVSAAITPWNANYTHICAKLAPAIAAGCTTVIKPSELSALQTQLLCECFHQADVPPGLINVINGTGVTVGAALCRHPDISMITFTGSMRVGREIGKAASETMKRVTLELGGKSPNIFLADADLEKAVPMALRIAFSNSGQACHADTRLIVPESKIHAIRELVKSSLASVRVGNPLDTATYIGPVVSRKQYDAVQAYIQSGIDAGAELLAGGLGHSEGLAGYYVQPTVFTNVTSEMRIAREEIFGPVLSVMTYRTEDEAVALANDTIYGLAAYISSGNSGRARAVASRIMSGRVLINRETNSEPQAPFGGFKQSGIGRTSGRWGLERYLETKVIA